MNELSGRKYETKRMHQILRHKSSDLLALFGRRRVGKTFLVKEVYKKNLIFSITGIRDASKSQQLKNFTSAINEVYGIQAKIAQPKDWQDALDILKEYISNKRIKKKKVLFFDEFPWLASPRSGFIQAFDHFWNSWAVDKNIVVVICGSAATWMILNIINHKGGLHNRVTAKIHLKPFTLKETESYFLDQGIKLPRYEIVNIYMAIGGIPFYLRNISKGESAAQSIDKLCFGSKAILKGEFDNLYRALFNNHEQHIDVIKALSTKRKGLTRKEILKQTKLPSGGTFSQVLRELEESSFITSCKPYGKKERESLYRLTDEYSLFYLSFLSDQKTPKGGWIKMSQSASMRSWSGYTFESICYKHIDSIKQALGIEGIYTEESSMLQSGNKERPGFQIDLLIDRADNAINLCEAKYYNTEYILTKKEAEKIRRRKSLLQEATGNKKQIITTLISTYGLIENMHSHNIDVSLKLDSLFYG